MRDIKFRGKRINDGEWIEGHLFYGKNEEGEEEAYIVSLNYNCRDGIIDLNTCASGKVILETVGQYTRLKDENGKEIYEGDIIEYSYDIFTGNFDTKLGKGIITFDNGAFWIKPFEIEGIKVDMENEEWFLLYAVNEDTLEVLENIHDNPELLEV